MATYLAVICNAEEWCSGGFGDRDEFYISAESPQEAITIAKREWTERIKPMRPGAEIQRIDVVDEDADGNKELRLLDRQAENLGNVLASETFKPTWSRMAADSRDFAVFIHNTDDFAQSEESYHTDLFYLAASTADEAIEVAYEEWQTRVSPMRPACRIASIEVWPDDFDPNFHELIAERDFRPSEDPSTEAA